jgi:hypothetical protein
LSGIKALLRKPIVDSRVFFCGGDEEASLYFVGADRYEGFHEVSIAVLLSLLECSAPT